MCKNISRKIVAYCNKNLGNYIEINVEDRNVYIKTNSREEVEMEEKELKFFRYYAKTAFHLLKVGGCETIDYQDIKLTPEQVYDIYRFIKYCWENQ